MLSHLKKIKSGSRWLACFTTSWPLAKAWLTRASAMFSRSYFWRKNIWLEIGAEFWKYKSAQPKKRMGQHLFTSRCFNRETFSRKDSYIFRFWNALLRTIFLNVHRSIAHRDPLVWAWGGRWMLEIEEQESSTMMMMMMKMMMMMIKRKV